MVAAGFRNLANMNNVARCYCSVGRDVKPSHACFSLPAMRRAEEASSPGKMDVDTDHLQNKGRRCIVSVCYSLLVVRVGPLVIQHTRTPFQL